MFAAAISANVRSVGRRHGFLPKNGSRGEAFAAGGLRVLGVQFSSALPKCSRLYDNANHNA
jgi:hypothetical protein